MRRPTDPERGIAQRRPRRRGEIGRGRALDNLLIAPLNRAIALEKMQAGAMRIAEKLHFDMAGAADKLFEINFVFAESRFRLASGASHGVEQAHLALDRPHAAPAAAPRGFQHRPDSRPPPHSRLISSSSSGSGSVAGMTGTPMEIARLRAATLLPSVRIVSGFGPMKRMSLRGAGFGEFRALEKESVAGMDRIDPRHQRDADHLAMDR